MSDIYVICNYDIGVCAFGGKPCEHTYVSTYDETRFTNGVQCEVYRDDWGEKGKSSCDPICSHFAWQTHRIAKKVKKFEYHEDGVTIIDKLTLGREDIINYLAVDYGNGLDIVVKGV